ncbi:MAG: CopG family transcriptional regulator [Phycisphaerae bacterium]|nr:CopG family transcriptional regulator [Phycisphaerae bacterium]NIP53317.1 CopG family transcriptional regulator [Phycisphaerae bacterium]NIS49952.1 CopG family transcriptional regulator [Phycisphaerae bacterium]NIU07656.1 CopG family transcriptional regulator [Phycisphaerae bacterium]NIU57521.1 CopG family transcriptional regulator [Phycisphaerae bacterium]
MKKTNIKRATIYLDSDLHRALRIKAAETEHSMSELVQEAIKLSLSEDSIDLSAFEQRSKEPSLPFEDVLKKLRKNGKI